MRGHSLARWGAAAGALLALAILWHGGTPFPTQDGPSHLYNAHLWLRVGTPDYPAVSDVFERRSEPTSALPGHALLALFLTALGPESAENGLLTLYAALLMTALLGAGKALPGGWILPSLFPLFFFSQLILLGFYSFSLSVAVALYGCTRWCRTGLAALREWVVWGGLTGLAVLLHPAGGALLLGIPLLGEVLFGVGPRLQRAPWLARLVAGLVLLGCAVVGGTALSAMDIVWHDPRARLAEIMVPFAFVSNHPLSLLVALCASIGLWSGVVARIRLGGMWDDAHTRRCSFAFAVVFVAYFLVPDDIGVAGFLGLRLNFILCLFAAVVIATLPRMAQPGAIVVAGVFFLALFSCVVNAIERRHVTNAVTLPLVELHSAVPDHSRLLAVVPGPEILVDESAWVRPIQPELHAEGRLAVGRDIVLLHNYEALYIHFPIAFRAGRNPYGRVVSLVGLEQSLPAIRLRDERGDPLTDFVLWYQWNDPRVQAAVPPPTRAELSSACGVPVQESGPFSLFDCRG